MHKGAPKVPGTAFELYCDDTRPSLQDKSKSGDNVEEKLSSGWKELSDTQREEYESRADREMADYKKQKDAYDDAKAKEASEAAKARADESNDKAESTESDRPAAGAEEEGGSQKEEQQPQQQQEDVEMTNYDTDQETQGEKPEE